MNYFVYITTNPNRTQLYIGITNNLQRRILEHTESKGDQEKWGTKYFCYNLIYFERFENPKDAIAREKQIKKWNRAKKEALIALENPEWKFLDVFE